MPSTGCCMVTHPRWPAGCWKWSPHLNQWHYFSYSRRQTMLLTGNKQMHTWGLDPNTPDAPWRKLGSKPTSVQGSRTPQCHHVSKHSQAPATAEHHLLAIPCPSGLLFLLGVQTAPALHKLWARRARRRQRARAGLPHTAALSKRGRSTKPLCSAWVLSFYGWVPILQNTR